MADKSTKPKQGTPHRGVTRTQPKTNNHKKLPKLPTNARVQKRPLLRPPIPSPYSGANQPKTVYITAKTPFLSAVKRVEKLLQRSENRAVQSATTLVKNQQRRPGKRKFTRGAEEKDDEVVAIAETVEREKERRPGEVVSVKGTGKAVQKVLEVGLWFQERRDVYGVELRTGSVAAIDDVSVEPESVVDGHEEVEFGAAAGAEMGKQMDLDPAETKGAAGKVVGGTVKRANGAKGTDDVSESRIRYTSSLEVSVSLR